MAGLERNARHPASRRFHGVFNFGRGFLCAGLPAYHEDVGRELRYKFTRGSFVIQDCHGIHRREGPKDFGALAGRRDWPAHSLFGKHAGIAPNSYDENIAKAARLLKQTDMPRMQQIKSTRGADYALSVAFPLATLENQLILRNDCQSSLPPAAIESFERSILPCALELPRNPRVRPR
jgi:hypothetical protein